VAFVSTPAARFAGRASGVKPDENNAIIVTRKGIQPETIRTGSKHAPWEIFQIEYDYNYSSLDVVRALALWHI